VQCKEARQVPGFRGAQARTSLSARPRQTDHGALGL
jgi:hypothetical protein